MLLRIMNGFGLLAIIASLILWVKAVADYDGSEPYPDDEDDWP